MYDPKRKSFRKSYSKFKFAGIADIIGILPNGIMLALEVKRPSTRKRTTEHQQAFLEAIRQNNGLAGVVSSVEETEELLDKYTNANQNKID